MVSPLKLNHQKSKIHNYCLITEIFAFAKFCSGGFTNFFDEGKQPK